MAEKCIYQKVQSYYQSKDKQYYQYSTQYRFPCCFLFLCLWDIFNSRLKVVINWLLLMKISWLYMRIFLHLYIRKRWFRKLRIVTHLVDWHNRIVNWPSCCPWTTLIFILIKSFLWYVIHEKRSVIMPLYLLNLWHDLFFFLPK